jgi:hypothetical protein
MPAFTPQKHVDALIALTHTHRRGLPDAHAKRRLILSPGLVAEGRPLLEIQAKLGHPQAAMTERYSLGLLGP